MMLKERKNLRLKHYDYNTNGAYFITFCTHNMTQILAVCVGAIHESPEMTLTDMGAIVKDVIDHISIPHINIPYYTIMPNHVHLIIETDDYIDKNKRSIISKIIGKIKMNSSKQIHELYGDINVWQRGFYDHVIRDENDYISIVEYIQNNPLKWVLDKYYK